MTETELNDCKFAWEMLKKVLITKYKQPHLIAQIERVVKLYGAEKALKALSQIARPTDDKMNLIVVTMSIKYLDHINNVN